MKTIVTTFVIFITTLPQLVAQNCIDTVRVKGYYVIRSLKIEIAPPEITQKDNTKTISNKIDVHRNVSFIPCDSIDSKHSLGQRLAQSSNLVFVSCEQVPLKYLTTCSSIDTGIKSNCSFPAFNNEKYYHLVNSNSPYVFEIYYIDANWAKFKVKKGTIQETMVPSRIAETTPLKEFEVYYFIKANKVEINPKIKDKNLSVWKK